VKWWTEDAAMIDDSSAAANSLPARIDMAGIIRS
jgi:hypothetical protein